MVTVNRHKVEELLEGFRKCTSSQVVDAIEEMALPDATRCAAIGLQPLDRTLPTMAGIAVTMLEGPRRVGTKQLRLTQHGQQMRKMGPNQVLVISAGGLVASCNWGGLLNLEGMRRGLSGVVVDGAVRDVNQIIKAKMPVFCKGSTPLACHLLMETLTINQPIVCAGVHVRAGDFVIGDDTGVCFVPPEFAEDVLKIALRKAKEEDTREYNVWHAPVERLEEANKNLNFKL